MIFPALPQLRLCADTFERLGEPAGTPVPARFDIDKFALPVGRSYCPEPRNLAAIHVLASHEHPEVILEPLHGFDSLKHLLSNLYRPEFLRGLAGKENVMRLAHVIARKATIMKVTHGMNADRIDELIDRLESEWRRHNSINPKRRNGSAPI